jgi:uncharacterized protein YybS (DUF2232 family)
METEQNTTSTTQGKEPWTLQKKIVVAIIAIVIIVVVAVAVAKLFYNVNLLDPAQFSMRWRIGK